MDETHIERSLELCSLGTALIAMVKSDQKELATLWFHVSRYMEPIHTNCDRRKCSFLRY